MSVEFMIMNGLGTVVNMAAIVIGGLLGMVFGNRMSDRFQDTLLQANGIAVIFIGAAGAMEKMLSVNGNSLTSGGSMLIIGCLSIGGLLGELINIEQKMENFGGWLKKKTGSDNDSEFIDAFVTATLTVCIGAMAVVGSIQDGIYADHSILFAKAVLDFVIIMVMAASMGKGCVFSAIPVGVFQGSVTLLAVFLKPFITELAMFNLSMVGSILIFGIGINIVFGKKIKVGNLLPSLVIAVIWSFLPF